MHEVVYSIAHPDGWLCIVSGGRRGTVYDIVDRWWARCQEAGLPSVSACKVGCMFESGNAGGRENVLTGLF
jgi:hypothetical protein